MSNQPTYQVMVKQRGDSPVVYKFAVGKSDLRRTLSFLTEDQTFSKKQDLLPGQFYTYVNKKVPAKTLARV